MTYLVLMLGTACTTPDVEAPMAPGVEQLARHASQLAWGACPPDPLAGAGCQMAVLEGDPRSRQLFTARFRTTEPFVLPPHRHARHERVTLLDGSLWVGFGTELDKARGQRFETGDYYVNGAGAAHFVWADEPVVLQITGIGPWTIEPVGSGP